MQINDYYEKRSFPVDSNPQILIIAFHGYGRNGISILNDFFDLNIENSKIIAPNSPTLARLHSSVRSDVANNIDNDIVNNYKRQWIEIDDIWQQNRTYDHRISYERLNEITVDIINFIDNMLIEYNLQYSNLVLLGFSQGAIIANHVGLKMQEPCAGIISLGGFVMSSELLKNDIVNKPPILIINGDSDTIVPKSFYDESIQFFEENNFYLEKHLISDLEHEITHDIIQLVDNFIKNIIE